MTFDFSYPNKPANERGWGPGWPNCQTDKMVPVAPFAGNVRKEIAELLELLVSECKRRGFAFLTPGCWGLGCRPTKRSDGTFTDTPSNHSWGLAVDINAPQNVFGASSHNLPAWLPPLFKEYGFRWLGPAIKDWMHFDFCGTPQDAAAMTAKARENLGDDDDVKYDEFATGVRARMRGEKEPADGPARFGWRFADWAANRPHPADHSHPGVPEHEHKPGGVVLP